MIVPAEKSAGQNSAYRHHIMKGASETERPSLFATQAWVDSTALRGGIGSAAKKVVALYGLREHREYR
jgi:hypothetical protein